MGRPKKAAHASRANGAMASNKGKAVDVKKELFGGFDDEGRYVISVVDVRRTMAKGEVRVREVGCEHDVFTYCLYHGDLNTSTVATTAMERARGACTMEPWMQTVGMQLRNRPGSC
jgi:hypothetical protein